jgi:hypothetical protein
MQHSCWDLEVHVREMQRQRLREADRARHIDAARQRNDQMGISEMRFGISQLMNAVRDCLSHRRGAIDGAAAPALAGAALLPLPVEEPRLSPDARSGARSQLYAGMVVVARGTSTQSAAQPCATSDC